MLREAMEDHRSTMRMAELGQEAYRALRELCGFLCDQPDFMFGKEVREHLAGLLLLSREHGFCPGHFEREAYEALQKRCRHLCDQPDFVFGEEMRKHLTELLLLCALADIP